MPRSKPKLVLYLLLTFLTTVPPRLAAAYVISRHAVASAAMEVAGAAALEQARTIAAHVSRDVDPTELERRCHDEVRGSSTRLTIIDAQGEVLCDSEADPARMVNHLER